MADKDGPYEWIEDDGTERKAYCQTTINGGGWQLAYGINPSDGNDMGFGSPYWTSERSEGFPTKTDFVDHQVARMPAEEIMIVNGYEENGSYRYATVWPFRVKGNSLYDYLSGTGSRSGDAYTTCDTVRGQTANATFRSGNLSSVPWDPIANQGGNLYLNFMYGNNGHRFMSGEQCTASLNKGDHRNGLSCVNDDSMLGLSGDFATSFGYVNPGTVTSWTHDVLVYHPDNCLGSQGSLKMGTDLGTSMASDPRTPDNYVYTIWVRTTKKKSPPPRTESAEMLCEVARFDTPGSHSFVAPAFGTYEVLVVGGGGGGGARGGGGGGGGGVVHHPAITLRAGQEVDVVVGGGGSGGNNGCNAKGSNGGDSQFIVPSNEPLIAMGGGGGGTGTADDPPPLGGSGGGGSFGAAGGAGTQRSMPGDSGRYGHGYEGGLGTYTVWNGGGGGGAGGPGTNGSSISGGPCGNGGPGYLFSTSECHNCRYGGGGGGGSHDPVCSPIGWGGLGGGGDGGHQLSRGNAGQAGGDGTPGTGGGGGGGSTTSGCGGTGGSGASGVVIVAKQCFTLDVREGPEPESPPTHGVEVRLVNGWGITANPAGTGTYTMGRIEIRKDGGAWGTVCDDGFSGVDSQVVCRQLHPSWTVSSERCCARFGRGRCGSAHVRKSPNRRRATRFLVPVFFAEQKRSLTSRRVFDDEK